MTATYPEVGNFDDFALFCPCQVGSSCGYCVAGRHDRCHGGTIVSPETYILDRRGYVCGPPVWQTGYACRWLCDCAQHGHDTPQGALW